MKANVELGTGLGTGLGPAIARWAVPPPLRRRWKRGRLARFRNAALEYAAAGWPVLPVHDVEPTERRAPSGAGVLPPDRKPTTDPATIAAWWEHIPYRVAVECGTALEVVDAPAQLGSSAHKGLSLSTPTAVRPGGRWLFLVTPGEMLPSRLADAGVYRCGPGQWAALPPSASPSVGAGGPVGADAPVMGGSAYWMVAPRVVDWQPMAADFVYAALLAAIAGRSRAGLGNAGRAW